MASSSVSQESLDITDDYELNNRRTRIRTMRARGELPPPNRGGDRDSETSNDRDGWGDVNGDATTAQHPTLNNINTEQHDSPSRTSAAQRAKDKRSRPNHLQKGKLPKDKRKLREKRRSTGVVHLASTESTGDSLDDDEEEEKVLNEAKRNTPYNEVIDADNPQTPSEVMQRIHQFQSLTISVNNNYPTSDKRTMAPKSFGARRNKSPSDLEADLEDNQDYDSTVSQSDSNLTLIGMSAETYQAPKVPERTYHSPHTVLPNSDIHQKENVSPSVLSRYKTNELDSVPSYSSRSSYARTPKSPKASRQTNPPSDIVREPNRPVSSVLARYQEVKQEEPVGYRSRFSDREVQGVRGPIAASLFNKDNKTDDAMKRRLEKDLEREKDETRRLQKVIEDKDKRIAELERQLAIMNRDVDDFEDENQKLQIENRALIQAIGQLSQSANGTNV